MSAEESEVTGVAEHPDETKPIRVVVTDLDISFGKLVGLIIKVVFASIPAALFIAFIAALFFAVITGVMRG